MKSHVDIKSNNYGKIANNMKIICHQMKGKKIKFALVPTIVTIKAF